MGTPPTLITLSFSGDLECCRLLCETADRFAPAGAAHLLAVPAADMPLFRPLAGGRRSLVPQEELLPGWLRKVPLPGPEWRRRLFLPRRNVYLSFRGRPVRGWIAQQIMKLNAAAGAGTETILHLDSDTAFVRPLPAEALGTAGRVRLARFPGAADDAMHAPWHRAASTLLGLPPSNYHGADYIDQFVTWRRDNVRGLLARIGETTGRDPIEALAATRDFSEYVLYGVYCDRVLGLSASGHAETALSLCETVWSEAEGGGIPQVGAGRYGLGIQSTIPLTPTARRRIVAEAIDRAA
ncbi:DUF6492 family protein [Methylobacterium aerolatum]|uniref:Glycosyl transferase family 2 n=1 Tax=Methylobacterium aerolatum TaxID=418708 RepID=A0ABU0HTS7_9HYPH|nr:DUF6492 family protein [Methylobacterium aerolatum]MDQ0445727.1 hypothetical protein [Methylobacterium aerolatum]GJD36012.1 hypothetical protein FMGBMHLM_2926 [Methylobacterium aerolatum]